MVGGLNVYDVTKLDLFSSKTMETLRDLWALVGWRTRNWSETRFSVIRILIYVEKFEIW